MAGVDKARGRDAIQAIGPSNDVDAILAGALRLIHRQGLEAQDRAYQSMRAQGGDVIFRAPILSRSAESPARRQAHGIANWRVFWLALCLLGGLVVLHPTFRFDIPNLAPFVQRVRLTDASGRERPLPLVERDLLFSSKADSFSSNEYNQRYYWHLDRSLVVDQFGLELLLAIAVSLGCGLMFQSKYRPIV